MTCVIEDNLSPEAGKLLNASTFLQLLPRCRDHIIEEMLTVLGEEEDQEEYPDRVYTEEGQ